MPSYSTFRQVLQRVDFEPILELFNHWRQVLIQLVEPTRVAVNGKSIKSTLSDDSESCQSFVTTIAAFTQQTGVVLHLHVMDNKQTSELAVVCQLIAAFAGQPVVFTLDALPCQKKVAQITQSPHYLIALKANPPTLYRTFVPLPQSQACLS